VSRKEYGVHEHSPRVLGHVA